jgi:DNA-binding NarL/FixJ family response regulator
MNILLADDSEMILQRLERMLSENDKIKIVGKARNSSIAYDQIKKSKPDLVILDIEMPGGDGIELLKIVKKEMPGIKVMMLTNYNLLIFKHTCLGSGAEYFLDKSNEFEQVVEICNTLAMHDDVL